MTDIIPIYNERLNSALSITEQENNLVALRVELSKYPIYQEIQGAEAQLAYTRAAENELKTSILDQMLEVGMTDFETDKCVVSIRKSQGALVVDDEKHIPEQYFRIKTTKELDKKLIKQKMEEGENLPGCSLDYKFTLNIKPKECI